MIQLRLPLSFPRRLAARLKRRFPLLFFLPGFCVGQSAAYCCATQPNSSILLLVLCVVLGAGCWAWRGLFLVSLLAGLVSGAAAFMSFGHSEIRSDNPYLVRVLREPQRPRVGQVKFSLSILGEVSSHGQLLLPAYKNPPKALCTAVDLPWKNAARQQQGSQFIMRGQFYPISPPLNPFAYNATLYRHGYSHTCKIRYAASVTNTQAPSAISQLRAYLKERVYAILGTGERAGLALAMSIGVRDGLSEPTEEAFKITGLAHLLVASGYQVTLLFFSVCWLLGIFVPSIPLSQGVFRWRVVVVLTGLAASLLFVALVGLEGSVVRAAFAILFAISGQLFERGTSFGNSILLSLLLVALVWPGCYFEPGIQLTFAALWGLALASKDASRSKFSIYLRACLLACLGTSTISLAWFGRLSIWTFILNPLLAPLGSLVGCKGVLCALVLLLCGLDPSGYALRAVSWILMRYADGVSYFSEFSGTSIELDGWSRVAAIAVMTCSWCYLVLKALRRYADEYNLGQVVRSECRY